MRRLLTLIFGFHVFLAGAFASRTLVILVSDEHSRYQNLPLFIQSFSRLTQDFIGRWSDGKIKVILNGDQVGLSGGDTSFGGADISTDYGMLGLDVYTLLANYAEFAVHPGNHEEFDWSPGFGNEIFLRNRTTFLQEMGAILGRRQYMVSSNLVPHVGAKHLFADYQDSKLGNGQTVRFVGLMLDRFYKKTNYQPKEEPRIIKQLLGVEETAKKQIELAASHGIERMILSIHDGIGGPEGVDQLIGRVEAWRAAHPNPRVRTMQMPLWPVGHVHSRDLLKTSTGASIVQVGSQYDFARIEFDEEFKMVSEPTFYGRDEQTTLVKGGVQLRAFEEIAMNQVKRRLDTINAALKLRTVITTNGITETKEDLKKQRTVLGVQLAEMLRLYGVSMLPRLKADHEVHVVSMFNSSSYKLDSPIPPGKLTSTDFLSMYPYLEDELKLVSETGPELQQRYTSLRKERLKEGVHCPQLSKNLREKPGGDFTLELFHEGKWIPLPHSNFLVVFDPYLGRNGYDIDLWRALKGVNPELKGESITSVYEAHAGQFNCPELLDFIREHGLVQGLAPLVAATPAAEALTPPASKTGLPGPRPGLVDPSVRDGLRASAP